MRANPIRKFIEKQYRAAATDVHIVANPATALYGRTNSAMRIKRKHLQQQQPQQPPPQPHTSAAEHSPPPSTSPPRSISPNIVPTVNLPPLEKINFDNRIKRKNVLALNEKVAAIREYDKMPVYKHVGRIFSCSPDQIKRIVHQRAGILKAWEQRTRRSQDAKTLELKVVRVSMLGKAVYDWIRRMMYYKDFMITDGLIQKMALQFKSSMGLQNFFPHQEWCDKFRQTYSISMNDTKLLKIGYTQGYSVQIKDIIKDVLTECTPDTANDLDDEDDLDDMGDGSDTVSENEEDVDIDGDGHGDTTLPGDGRDIKPNLALNINQTLQSAMTTQLPAHILPSLQPLHQLLTLPIKSNAPLGSTQKVLVATPISTPGQPRNDSAPMTMTIIPLATLAQSVQQQQQQQQQQLEQEERRKKRAAEKALQTVPPPIMEIKQEIKEEPKDAEEDTQTQTAPAESAAMVIKQEVISEDEAEVPASNTEMIPIASLADVLASIEAGKIQSQEVTKKDEIPKSPPKQKDTVTQTPRRTMSTRRAAKSLESTPAAKPAVLVPSVMSSTQKRAAEAAQEARHRSKRRRLHSKTQNHNNNNNNNNNNNKNAHGPPAITSCAEARKYLKLLEDFALYKANFRLIGLITRADEVLRELDNDRDHDVDID